MKTYLDWSAYDTYGIGDAFSGIPATGGNYAKAVAVCMHSHDCHKTRKGVMCPSYRVTGNAGDTPEARVAAFKAALNGEFGEKPFADARLAAAMDLCVSCKGCKKECPSAVDMTLIKTEYLAHRNALLGFSWRTWLFANLPRWTGYHRRLLRLAIGLRNRSRLLAKGLPKPCLASPPIFRSLSFPNALSRLRPLLKTPRAAKCFLFADTFATYFEPDIASAAIEVLTAAGYSVKIAKPAPDDPEPDRPLCCGRTYLTHGWSKRHAAKAAVSLTRFARR